MGNNVRIDQLAAAEVTFSKDDDLQVTPLTTDQLDMVGGGDMQVIIG